MKEKNMTFKKLCSQLMLFIGITLISIPFFIVVISSLLFLFKISISPINFYLAIVLLIIFSLFLFRNLFNKTISLKKILLYLGSIGVIVFIFLFSIYIGNKYNDTTYDGNTYHKQAIGALKEGWNPVYNDLGDFEKDNNLIFKNTERTSVWGNHYPKATWIYSANTYTITGNIESGKSIGWVLVFGVFMIMAGYLLSIKKNWPFAIFVALLTGANALFVSQCFSFYVDMILGLYLYLLIFATTIFCFEKDGIKKWIKYYIYISSMIMIINIKFTGLAYAGIYCLAFYLFYLIATIKRKNSFKPIIRFTIISFITLLFAIFVVGLSSYCKNFVEKGNPLWPLFGKGTIDIMIKNQPDYFKDKSAIDKFIIANFSKTANISQASKEKAEWKIPFTISKSEKYSLSNVDNRIGGYGVWFGGILIISIILILISLPKLCRKNKQVVWPLLIPILATFILTFTLNEVWWARYFPQLYLFPIIAVLMVDFAFDNKIIKSIIVYPVLLLLLINNFYNFKYNLYRTIKEQNEINSTYSYFVQVVPKNELVELYYPELYSSGYNVKDFLNKHGYKNQKIIKEKINYVKYAEGKQIYYFEHGYTMAYVDK